MEIDSEEWVVKKLRRIEDGEFFGKCTPPKPQKYISDSRASLIRKMLLIR